MIFKWLRARNAARRKSKRIEETSLYAGIVARSAMQDQQWLHTLYTEGTKDAMMKDTNVNGIEIKAGQEWYTRGGKKAVILGVIPGTSADFPVCGYIVTDYGNHKSAWCASGRAQTFTDDSLVGLWADRPRTEEDKLKEAVQALKDIQKYFDDLDLQTKHWRGLGHHTAGVMPSRLKILSCIPAYLLKD